MTQDLEELLFHFYEYAGSENYQNLKDVFEQFADKGSDEETQSLFYNVLNTKDHQVISLFLETLGTKGKSDLINQPISFLHKTALMYAVSKGNSNIVELLIKYGADVNIEVDKVSALGLALSESSHHLTTDTARCIKLLISNGASMPLDVNTIIEDIRGFDLLKDEETTEAIKNIHTAIIHCLRIGSLADKVIGHKILSENHFEKFGEEEYELFAERVVKAKGKENLNSVLLEPNIKTLPKRIFEKITEKIKTLESLNNQDQNKGKSDNNNNMQSKDEVDEKQNTKDEISQSDQSEVTLSGGNEPQEEIGKE